MRISIFFITIVTVLFLSSCSKKLTYFTNDIKQEFDLNDGDLRKVQFYLSQDIVLQRRVKAEDTQIRKGQIKVVDGSKVEEIVFEKGTPGVFVFTPEKSEAFAISFEAGGDKRFLMFGPNKSSGERYVLLAKDWERNSGLVRYDGREYRTSSSSAYASLLVDLKNAKKAKINRRSADGRKVR